MHFILQWAKTSMINVAGLLLQENLTILLFGRSLLLLITVLR